MGLFRKKKKEEEIIDTRTKIEKSFEEKGQKFGKKAGEIVQKGVDKYDQVKQKLEDDGTMDKVRNVGNKIDDTIDKVVDEVTKQTKKAVSKVKKKPQEKEEDLFYE